jgi:hypothetical protein
MKKLLEAIAITLALSIAANLTTSVTSTPVATNSVYKSHGEAVLNKPIALNSTLKNQH